MKNKNLNFIFIVIIFTFLSSINSIYILNKVVNPFLINTVRFVLLSSLIFVFFEKRVLINFKKIIIPSLYAGLLFTIFFTLQTLSLKYSNPLSITVILIIPIIFFFKNFNFKIKSTLLLLSLIIIVAEYISLFNYFFIFSLIIILSIIIKMYKVHKHKFIDYPIESIFVITGVIGIISTILFFLTKPDMVQLLNQFEKIHLISLIITASIIPVFLLSAFPNLIKKINKNVFFIALLISTIILNFHYADFHNIIAVTVLFIIILMKSSESKIQKGFSRVETLSIIMLFAVLFSLIMPLLNTINENIIIKNDRVLFENNRTPDNIFTIGSLYIKYINNSPAYLYEYKDNKFTSIPIR